MSGGFDNQTIVWVFSDGKRGHDAQSKGLIQALEKQINISLYSIALEKHKDGFGAWLLGDYKPGRGLRDPDILVGAGHGSHWPMLAARRCRGGKIITLMKPSLPTYWFDLCVIPEHDAPFAAKHIFTSKGALNAVTPSSQQRTNQGLILLGGPSKHYGWDEVEILNQVDELIKTRKGMRWHISSSPRTPDSLVQLLEKVEAISFHHYQRENQGWLFEQLASAGEVWVSEDSVSMVYEALTAGARVGLLSVPRESASRVSRGIDRLLEDGWVRYLPTGELMPIPVDEFNEAARCATWIREKWLEG